MPDVEEIKKIIDNLMPVWLTAAGPREIVTGIGLHMFDLGHRSGIIETLTRSNKMGELIEASDLKQGDRILFKVMGSRQEPQNVTEGKVREISPSRKWICIELAYENRKVDWYEVEAVDVKERLEEEDSEA